MNAQCASRGVLTTNEIRWRDRINDSRCVLYLGQRRTEHRFFGLQDFYLVVHVFLYLLHLLLITPFPRGIYVIFRLTILVNFLIVVVIAILRFLREGD